MPEKVISEPTEIRHWLRAHSEVGQHDDSAADVIPGDVRGDALLELVGRVSRYKPFWLKHGDEKAARRILDDQNWERLRDILEEHDLLLTRRNIGAGGKPSRFYHVRRKSDILAEQLNDSQIADFYRGVVAAIHSTKS